MTYIVSYFVITDLKKGVVELKCSNFIITISDFFTGQFLSNMENELQLQNQNKTKKRWTDNSGIIWPYETLQ